MWGNVNMGEGKEKTQGGKHTGWTEKNMRCKNSGIHNFQRVSCKPFGVYKNEDPSTAYDPIFLLQNPFLLKKVGCLQKTRAQSVKI